MFRIISEEPTIQPNFRSIEAKNGFGQKTYCPIKFDEEADSKLQAQKEYLNIQYQYQASLDWQRTQNKKELATHKDNLKRKNELDKELSTLMLLEDQDGCIRYGIRTGDDKCAYSKPIISVRHLKLKKVGVNDGDEHLFFVSWEGCKKPVLIKELVAKKFTKALETSGVGFYIPRRKKSTIIDLLISYLSQNADEVVLPRTKGWNYFEGDDKWRFVQENEETYDKYEGKEND